MKKFSFMGLNASTGSIGSKFAKGLIASIMLSGSVALSAADFYKPYKDGIDVFYRWEKSNFRDTPISLTFYGLESISTTDIHPYVKQFSLDASQDKVDLSRDEEILEFQYITCNGNKLELQGIDGATYDSAIYYLVIPEGAIVAEDGTVNTEEYRFAYYQLDLKLTYKNHNYLYINDIDIVRDYNDIDKVRNYQGGERSIIDTFGFKSLSYDITVYSPNYDRNSYGYNKGYVDEIKYFKEAGTYVIEADLYGQIADVNTEETLDIKLYMNDYVQLNGLSGAFDVEYVTNDLDQLTGLIMKFSEAQEVVQTYFIYDIPYLKDDNENIFEIDNHYSEGNAYCLNFNEPLATPGNYTLV